jgi:hypothetical protein
VLVNALMEIDPRYPRVDSERRRTLLTVKEHLESEAPPGTAADPNAERRTVPDRGGSAPKPAPA